MLEWPRVAKKVYVLYSIHSYCQHFKMGFATITRQSSAHRHNIFAMMTITAAAGYLVFNCLTFQFWAVANMSYNVVTKTC